MVIIGAIVLVLATVFVLENQKTIVTIEFLAWSYTTSLGVALLAAVLVGAVIIYVSSFVKQAQLRAQLRSAEARLRDLERQQRQAEGGDQAARV
ncbi:MAG: LapA family protein [Armatimonadota bacterium]|nr:LapA family protein [Armatimonadota bacterium]MDR7451919.1 LapA family protein [Armatimonadota bacterium]MDR7466601.1 LapA family protein [Armatimonadota bacterium]MDR7492925.1 LapA family protein [Armatimonadota bacterium]MDR7500322.1 LapA family protein [Armatimonadota bacterium]